MFEHCLYFQTTALARRLESEWAKVFKPYNLTPPQAFMLRAIVVYEGLLPCELANLLSISRATVTRALDGLEAKQWIIRKKSTKDGRESLIFATSKAKAIKNKLDEASISVGTRLKQQLDTSVFTESVARLRSIREALDL